MPVYMFEPKIKNGEFGPVSIFKRRICEENPMNPLVDFLKGTPYMKDEIVTKALEAINKAIEIYNGE